MVRVLLYLEAPVTRLLSQGIEWRKQVQVVPQPPGRRGTERRKDQSSLLPNMSSEASFHAQQHDRLQMRAQHLGGHVGDDML